MGRIVRTALVAALALAFVAGTAVRQACFAVQSSQGPATSLAGTYTVDHHANRVAEVAIGETHDRNAVLGQFFPRPQLTDGRAGQFGKTRPLQNRAR